MKNVKLLDTTLRDGARIIDGEFSDAQIAGITSQLVRANIDIIEMGFLRGNVEYNGNSIFFSRLEQIEKFIPQKRGNSMYVAFSDYGKEYGMWDFSRIKPNNGRGIDGLRVGYRKKDLKDAIPFFNIVKDNGYKLFIQGVESLSYSDLEMLQTIEIINKIKPYSFGIVDTYGAMYKDDVLHFFSLLDHNLDEDIAIDFHSHNNMMLSFSFAQEVVEASRGVRNIIIDTTLNGVGKGVGNLNTELIVDFLNRKKYYNYDADVIFDTIEEYVDWIRNDYDWNYQIPYFMAGIYSSHANNISYLQNKHRLGTRDIKNILAMMEPEKRKRYDYENLEKLYIEYCGTKVDDSSALQALSVDIGDDILVLVPGSSLTEKSEMVSRYIEEKSSKVISVNFVDKRSDFVFFGNQKKYDRFVAECDEKKIIVSSNVKCDKADYIIDYNGIIDRKIKYFDNSTVMLLNILLKIGKENLLIAGLDGFDYDKLNYYDKDYNLSRYTDDYEQINKDLETFLKDYGKRLQTTGTVKIITGGRFEKLL